MGLRKEDLKYLIDPVFEVDSFASKMGEDKDIVTVSFSVHEREAAKDLMNFCEKGYPFVLDADVSTGEQADGTYKVFIEMERDSKSAENIDEMIYGIKDLAGLDDIRFRYYKSFKSQEATLENLTTSIPSDGPSYESLIQESKLNHYQNFFNKSFVDSIVINEFNELTISKVYAQPVTFEVIDFGNTLEVTQKIDETINLDDMGEILFLTKYLGDYNISKFGKKLSLTNEDKTLVVKRKVK